MNNARRCDDPLEFLRITRRPTDVFEVRAPKCPDRKGGNTLWVKTAAGYFRGESQELSGSLAWLESVEPAGIYVTLNPVQTDLFARSANKITTGAQSTTSDADITERRWLLVDIDPVRPSGVSASNEEMDAALALGRRIRDELKAEGWPEPLYGMSGNGCYLLYRVDLPNNEPTTELVKGVLLGLAQRFKDPRAAVDTATFNASRIAKILGTTARKSSDVRGVEGIVDRPHRRSWFIPPADEPGIVTGEQLQSAAIQGRPTGCPPSSPASPPPRPQGNGPPNRAFELCLKYLDKCEPSIQGQKGSDKALRAACIIFEFGLDDDDARAAFAHFNARCDPPWADHEIAHKLTDARKKVIAAGTFGRKRQPRRMSAPKKSFKPSPIALDANVNGAQHSKDDFDNADLPQVILPGHVQTITDTSAQLGRLLGATGRFYVRGGVPVRQLNDANEVKLDTLRPAAACSDFEGVAKLLEWKVGGKDGLQLQPTICKEHVAKQIVAAESFRGQLPPITVLSHCPVLLVRNGQLVVVTDYDRESGIWAQGEKPPDMPVDEARELLSDLLAEFNFETPSDRSRALAAVITPALVFGGLLSGRAPVDLGEADSSQAGKGYRNKLTTAIYRHAIKTVTQRERGVGSLQESFDAKLVAGANLISLDNLRGKLASMGIESFLTEPTYSARIPYSPPMEIETGRVIIMVTTNRADLTTDLANRSSIVRIQKSASGTVFRYYPEGDLLAHVIANQPRYLGAVFAIVQEWFRQGKPSLSVGDHDFRAWAGKLGWIIQHLLGAAPLLDGHREVQKRIAMPGANWLRDVALSVKEAAKTGTWLRVSELLAIVWEAGIETAGIDYHADLENEEVFKKANQALGRRLGKLVKEGVPAVVGSIRVERRSTLDKDHRTKNEYCFSLEPNYEAAAEIHHNPETEGAAPYSVPYENAYSPIPLIDHQSLYADACVYEESTKAIRGLGGEESHRGGIASGLRSSRPRGLDSARRTGVLSGLRSPHGTHCRT